MIKTDVIIIGVELEYSRTKVLFNGANFSYEKVPLDRKGYIKSQIAVTTKLIKALFKYKCKHIYISSMNQNYSIPIIILSRLCRKKVISDLLISEYDTLVNDRKLFKKHSLTAYKAYFNDWFCVKFANYLICDTELHKEYFLKKYSGRENKFKVIPVGAEEVFKPLLPINEQCRNEFCVLFYGGFSPLHGIETILKAASLLLDYKGIYFKLIGNGQTKSEMVKLAEELGLNNVHFSGNIPYDELPETIHQCDVGLGIFGLSEKADRVIPNKVYQIAACAKPIVTLGTAGIRLLFKDKENIILIHGDLNHSEQLAEAILELYHNPEYMNRLGEAAYQIIQSTSSQKIVQSKFKECLNH
ncbi:glycosyltransferase family 4 protein [Paenibacillus humicus]|uniref:glycosyltransferase family 4 protein n=1 Tax=Paenibacillus humicus TaxID=412861 RepID=UPI000FDA0B51|nr:glycosyltransferase family 4 protein [Paenibacillus humicus]